MDQNIVRGLASVTLVGSAYSGLLSIGDSSYVDGGKYLIKVGANSPTNATLNLNSIGDKNIVIASGANIGALDMTIGKWYEVVFNSVLDKFEINTLGASGGGGGGTVTDVFGTPNRIDSTGGNTPTIDISATYVGQTSIITTGTITTGIWAGRSPYVAKTGVYVALTSDEMINCTSGTFTVTLPSAVGIPGKKFLVKNSGTGIITVNTTAAQTIDGDPTAIITTKNCGGFESNGANYIII